MNRRTYGKKIPVVQKAMEMELLFDKALKEQFCDTVSTKKIAAGQIRERKTQKEIDSSHKRWDLEVEETNDNTSQDSSFMIFESKRVEKTKTRKQKAKNMHVPSKGKRRQNAESSNRKVKVNLKAQDNLSLPSPVEERNTSSFTPDLVVEEYKRTCRSDLKRTLAEDFPNENADVYSSSDRKNPKGKGLQGKAQKKRKKPRSENKKKANKRFSSSHHSNSSIEVARRSKDQTLISEYALPSSPVIDILKDNERKSSEEDIGDISFHPKGFTSCSDESDIHTDKKGPSTHDTSMWLTVSSNATPGEEAMPMDKLLQSPEVKMRQYSILNSTAKTAADNIAQLPFPSTLSPITQLAAEVTPHKGTQDKSATLSLPVKKLKALPLKKENSVQKCSTKLFTSSLMNYHGEEILDFTRISYTTTIRNDPSLLSSHSPKFNNKASSKKGKGSSELLSHDCKNPAPSVGEQKLEPKEKPTNMSPRNSSHLEAQRRNKGEQLSHILDKNNQSQKLKNTSLKGQEVVTNDTGKICSVILTPPAEDEKPSSSGKQSVHWCKSTGENKKTNSSAGISFREPVPKRSILKRSYETNCCQELSPPLTKKPTFKPIKVYKNLQEMIGDSSICLINRLFMKS